MDTDDVLVGDLAREKELALESPLDFGSRRRIGHHIRPNYLHCHGDAEFGIPSLVNRAHAADAELSNDVIARAERLARPQYALARCGHRRKRAEP